MKSLVKSMSLSKVAAFALFLTAILSLQSCVGWEPAPGPGYNQRFYDTALTGAWELVSINGMTVAPSNSNFFRFYGNGRGAYYYYVNGIPRKENISYWCEDSFNSVSRYELYVSYEGSSPSPMNYWFSSSGNYLTMQWYSDRGLTRYVYAYSPRLPYPFD